MKTLFALLLALTVLSISISALAEIEVEDKENLPPPMVVTYDDPITG